MISSLVLELVLILSSDGSGLVVGRNRIVGSFFGFFFFSLTARTDIQVVWYVHMVHSEITIAK